MTDALHAYIERMHAELEEHRLHSKAGPELLRRFEEAEHTFRAGYVVALAAGDCARAGSKYPLPAKDLIGLARDYFARLWPDEPVSDDELSAGIDWAASCEQGQLPLLIADGDDTYRASPALGDRAGFDVPPIPQETWEWLLAHLPPFRLLELGEATNLSFYKPHKQITERAWMRAFEVGQEPIRSAASISLGLLYADRGDDEDAITALECADTSLLIPSAQASAAFVLGLLYGRRKDFELARSYYEQAIAADDWRVSPNAAYNLGLLLGDLGDADGAEAAFTQAIEARYYPYQERAMHALAITLQKLGKIDRAKTYYKRAIATDSIISNVPAKAALDLGRLHEDLGETDEAVTAYEQALTGDAKVVAQAIWRHARLVAPKEHVEPIVIYQRLLTQMPGYKAEAVICQLGQWLLQLGERATAMVLFKQALAPDNWIAAKTAFWRGWLAHGEDNLAARAAYQEAIDSHHYEYAAKAATNLGVLLAEQGEEAEALAAFRLVRSLPRCTATPKAAFNTGVLLERAGRLEEARTAFEEAIDPYNPIRPPGAVARLAHLLLRTNEQDAAKALLEQWRNADDPDLAAAVIGAFEELRSCPTSGDLMIEPIWSS